MLNYPLLVVPRYSRRRSQRRMQPVIQSYKQITVDGPASRAAATTIFHVFVAGIDNYAGPTAANKEVPTGAVVKYITILASFTNLVSISALLHFNVVCQRSGMVTPTPGAVGGEPTRNTVIHTAMMFIGKEQNTNIRLQIKIPKIYQRIREGDQYVLAYRTDAVFASATQVIYKFYR